MRSDTIVAHDEPSTPYTHPAVPRSALKFTRSEATGRLLALCVLAGVMSACSQRGINETKALNPWDPKAAAVYLDQREVFWMQWAGAARNHGTFCVACHTAVPYALARPALRNTLAEDGLSVSERKLLNNVTKRVQLWSEIGPFYTNDAYGTDKTARSRGTEAVLNALILANYDALNGYLSETTRAAFNNMWTRSRWRATGGVHGHGFSLAWNRSKRRTRPTTVPVWRQSPWVSLQRAIVQRPRFRKASAYCASISTATTRRNQRLIGLFCCGHPPNCPDLWNLSARRRSLTSFGRSSAQTADGIFHPSHSQETGACIRLPGNAGDPMAHVSQIKATAMLQELLHFRYSRQESPAPILVSCERSHG